MKKNRGYARVERVGQQILEVLAALVLTDVQDPRVELVQITGVDCAPDLRSARVFFVLLDSNDERDIERALAGLESCSKFLRRELSDRISMKYLPELRFEYDVSIEEGRKIEALLAEVAEVRNEEE